MVVLCCSRLYTRVLNHYHWVQSCSSFNNTLNNTGLVGIQASCEPNRAQQMLDIMCSKYIHILPRLQQTAELGCKTAFSRPPGSPSEQLVCST